MIFWYFGIDGGRLLQHHVAFENVMVDYKSFTAKKDIKLGSSLDPNFPETDGKKALFKLQGSKEEGGAVMLV